MERKKVKKKEFKNKKNKREMKTKTILQRIIQERTGNKKTRWN